MLDSAFNAENAPDLSDRSPDGLWPRLGTSSRRNMASRSFGKPMLANSAPSDRVDTHIIPAPPGFSLGEHPGYYEIMLDFGIIDERALPIREESHELCDAPRIAESGSELPVRPRILGFI